MGDPLWSLALPYFNSEDSQRDLHHLRKSNSSKCCFLLSLSSREHRKTPHCFREKKRRWKNFFFSKHRCSFLVILYMMMSQLVSMSKRCKFCHLYACYAYF